MLYSQEVTLSKIQEAEKMGKKTVLIAAQGTQKRKGFIKSRGKDTCVDHAENNSKTIPGNNG